MRAIAVNQTESGVSVELADAAAPVPQSREVLIRIAAAGVNRADVLQRDGRYPPPAGAPPWLGLEVSGVVDAVGEDVTTPQVGDEVCALLPGGGYAEYVTVDAGCVFPVPAGIDLTTAAAIPEVACTVWSNVVMSGRLGKGERFLVHGGSSGIGSMAIQVTKALGATVATTAGTPEKVEYCRGLGADIVVNYRVEDFVERVAPGVDVILDSIGAKYLGRNVAALQPGGRLVVIGLLGGVKGELNLGALLAKGGTVCATSLRSQPLQNKVRIVEETRKHVWPMIDDGRVRIVVDSVFPLEKAGAALEYMESSRHMGKIVLTT